MYLKKCLFTLSVAMLLSACDNIIIPRSPAEYIDVDGETIKVLKTANDAGYVALAADIPLIAFSIPLRTYTNNIKAIEIASGCRVMPNSAINRGLVTAAQVICD